MRPLSLLTPLLLSACAAAPSQKMAWTYTPLEPAMRTGRGGPALEREPMPPPLPITRLAPPPETPPAALNSSLNNAPNTVPNTAPEAHAPVGALTLRWPVPATGINSLFGYRLDPLDGKRRFHYGVDFDGPYGALVRASARGLVVLAGWNDGHGRQVVIEHAGGFRTSYSHLSQVLVSPGEHVAAGQVIGRLGNSGRSTGPHLHFEVSRWGRPLDPLDILGASIEID